jgi:hypothetical protein
MNRDELRTPQHSRSRRSTKILLDVVAARAGQTRVHAVSGPGFRHRGLPLLLRTSHHVLKPNPLHLEEFRASCMYPSSFSKPKRLTKAPVRDICVKSDFEQQSRRLFVTFSQGCMRRQFHSHVQTVSNLERWSQHQNLLRSLSDGCRRGLSILTTTWIRCRTTLDSDL